MAGLEKDTRRRGIDDEANGRESGMQRAKEQCKRIHHKSLEHFLKQPCIKALKKTKREADEKQEREYGQEREESRNEKEKEKNNKSKTSVKVQRIYTPLRIFLFLSLFTSILHSISSSASPIYH